MRRLMIVPVLAAVLLAAACSSNSGTKKTVTVVNTVTSSHATSAANPSTTTGSSIVVGSSGSSTSGAKTGSVVTTPSSGPGTASSASTPVSGGGTSGSTTGTTGTTRTSTSTSTTKLTMPAFKKVDPTAANCADLLDADDVKTDLGATVGTTASLVRIGAGDNGAKKAIRCLYGSKDGGKTAPVRLRLTQYDTAAHAQKQLGIDLQSGGVTAVKVGGFPASLQLAAGGLVEMRYDTWTLTLAVSDGLASNTVLTSGLPKLAGQALAQVLRS